jgi:hypothetical protein
VARSRRPAAAAYLGRQARPIVDGIALKVGEYALSLTTDVWESTNALRRGIAMGPRHLVVD